MKEKLKENVSTLHLEDEVIRKLKEKEIKTVDNKKWTNITIVMDNTTFTI